VTGLARPDAIAVLVRAVRAEVAVVVVAIGAAHLAAVLAAIEPVAVGIAAVGAAVAVVVDAVGAVGLGLARAGVRLAPPAVDRAGGARSVAIGPGWPGLRARQQYDQACRDPA